MAVGPGTLGASEPAPSFQGSGDATTASLALLANYMASAFAAPSATSPVAGLESTPVGDLLTKPLA